MGYRELHFYADSCAAQNKNLSMVAFVLSYLNSAENKFSKIRFCWPIRGHSYLPPDRVFGRIERELRMKEVILLPDTYYHVYEKYGRVKKFRQHFRVYDFKNLSDRMLKKNVINSRQSRIWEFRKNDRSAVFVGDTYSGVFQRHNVLRPNVNVLGQKPLLLPPCSHVKPAKKADVKSLLTNFQMTDEEKYFYDTVLK